MSWQRTLETGFLERFKPLLSAEDHRRRLDRILVDSIRFSSERDDRAAIARRVIPLLPEAEQKKAEARLAVFLKAKTADKLLAALPAEAEGAIDWGLAYQRVQHLRALGNMDEVWKILTALPSDPDKLVSPDDWWMERRAAAYAALRADKPDIAYAVVRDPGPLSVNPLKDATFMAGWLALRHLDNAKAALPHFEASRAAADGPLTQARADYWLGRTFEALERRDEARKAYAAAAKLFDTFHGQLARHKVEPSAPALRASLPAMPTAEETKRFTELDAVKAVGIAITANLDRSIVRMLIGHLRYSLKTEGEVALLAQLTETLGDTQMVVRVGKTAIARGMNLVVYAYPVHTFPAYKPLRTPPEMAMLLGIARQESEFNAAIISTAGARGLLQVMPITARHICRDHNVKCDVPRLLTDNSYNAMIASAYIGDRMAEFSGNYVLTLAGYNAGPGRAREWVRAFGDPRTPKVDPIDWIESIPIEETREYVKKVLANIQVYRARLGEEQALRLTQDLKLRPAERIGIIDHERSGGARTRSQDGTAGLARYLLHVVRRPAPLCAALSGTSHGAPSLGLRSRPDAQWPRFSCACVVSQPSCQSAGARCLRRRPARARTVGARSELAELQRPDGDARRPGPHDRRRSPQARNHRHLAGRPHRHAHGHGASGQHGRRRAQRYRSGHRARWPDAYRCLHRTRAASRLMA